MNDRTESTHDQDGDATLDPPGSIVVVGAGPIGIEAALYGRFLGYDVTLIESVRVGQSMREKLDQPLPMFPDRCLSPLAVAAIQTQRDATMDIESADDDYPLPQTYRDWLDNWLIPLTETDLLRGRLRTGMRVAGISTVPVSADAVDADDGDHDEIPDDFRVRLVGDEQTEQTLDAEAVIVAIRSLDAIDIGFQPPVDYFFHLSSDDTADAESRFRKGLRQIVSCYSILGGRADLDLYRPRRGNFG